MNYNSKPNMTGDVQKRESRTSKALTMALEQKKNIKAAHKRIKKDGVDFNKI